LDLGCQRIAFVARPNSAQTVNTRIAGYREALLDRQIPVEPSWVQRGDPSDPGFIDQLLTERPEALICANDYTTALIIGALLRRGIRVPEEIRVAGVDDLKYAALLAVSLTAIHQPCIALGETAAHAMLERAASAELPGRDLLLHFHLVTRDSSGAYTAGGVKP
jgi:DNA-binding LacI/PurR family transcriptional regulator